jgi:hypothetical protein
MRKCLLFAGFLRDNFAIPMKLLMYFQNDLIASVSIESDKIVCPGYLSSFIRELRQKHNYLLADSYDEPEFLLHGDFIRSPFDNSPKTNVLLLTAGLQMSAFV